MTKHLFFSLMLLITTIVSFSQEPIPQHNYIGLGGGMSKVAIKDQLNTSVPYSGINLGTVFDVTTTFKQSFLQVRNIFTSGNLTPFKSKVTEKNKINSYYENLNMAFYWNVFHYKPQDIYLYAGPALEGKAGIRVNNGEVGNSGLTYEVSGSLALALKAAKYFNVFPSKEGELKDFKIEGSLAMPLISSVFTPPYIGLPENLAQEGSGIMDIKSNYLGYFSNYFNLEMGLSLTYYLKNRNAIEFSYFRDYSSTKPAVNPAKTLNQFLSIKLLYNLK